jgi:hypothetical protein
MSTTGSHKHSVRKVAAALVAVAVYSASPVAADPAAQSKIAAHRPIKRNVRDSYSALQPTSQNVYNNCGTGLMNIAIPCNANR